MGYVEMHAILRAYYGARGTCNGCTVTSPKTKVNKHPRWQLKASRAHGNPLASLAITRPPG